MKKYIRVEDGIYEFFDTHNGCSNHFGYKYGEYGTALLDEEDIKNYRQVDTIEELCDKWIVVENGRPHVLAYECDLLDKINNNKKDGIETIGFGAIWIKGEHNEPILKPAAKMNAEGGLDLL